MVPEPRIAVIPDRVRSAGPQIVKLAAMAGIQLDDAQRLIADATAGVGADNRWVAFESVIFSPRQNIKTEFLLARILAGLYLFREDYIVYSSHQVKTSSKTFRRLKRAIDRSPQLGARIKRVSNRIGAEQIELATGQVVEMVARSTNSGRGFTGDCILLDEAHELDADQLAAILPMLATVPNPSVFYALSMGNEHSSHVAGLRARALDGKPDVCWVEWSMADDDNVADRRVWARCNPAYPSRISMAYMEREFAALGPDRFARERLGKSEWPNGEPGQWEVFTEVQWLACLTAPVDAGPLALGAEISEDREHVSVAVARPLAGGVIAVDLAAYLGTSSGIAGVVRGLGAGGAVATAVDPRSPGATLVRPLELAGIRVAQPTTSDAAIATGEFMDGLRGGTVKVVSSPELDRAARLAVTRPLAGGDVWVHRGVPVDASPLRAATLAVWAAVHAPRFPEPAIF